MDALNLQVYAIPFPPHLLAHPSAPAPFLPEDIHICGNCKQSFTDIRYFLQHKNECNALLSSASAALLHHSNSSVDSQTVENDQPLLQVMISEADQPMIIEAQQNGEVVGFSSTDSANETANVLEAAATLLECGNVNDSGERRDVQIDEEDVASLLANQFAKEAVYILDESQSNVNCSGTIVDGEIYEQERNPELELVNQNDGSINTNTISQGLPDSSVENILGDSEGIRSLNNNIDISINNGDSYDHNRNECCRNDLQNVNMDVQVNGLTEIVREPLPLPAKRTYCNFCNFVTAYPSDLTRHMRKHTGEKPFECSICSQRFPRRDKLQTHIRIHTGEKPYRCQFCDYASIDSGPLRKHLRTHTNERPFNCQFCSYRSKDTSQLTVHLRTHTGDAPFVCQFEKCKRAFKTSTDLKRHGVVHERIHPFACRLCDYKASNKLNLQAHYQLSHLAVVIDNDVCKCVVSGCDFKTSNFKDFEAHQLNFHPVPDILNLDNNKSSKNNKKRKCSSRASVVRKLHTCSFCNHEACNTNSLKQHVRKQHSNSGNGSSNSTNGGGNSRLLGRPSCQKAYQCTLCPAAFVRQDSLRSHLKQHQNNNNNNNCDSATTSPLKQLNKQQFDSDQTLSSSDLIGNGAFFIDWQ